MSLTWQCHPPTSVSHPPVSPTKQCHPPASVIPLPMTPTHQCHPLPVSPPNSVIPPVSSSCQCHPPTSVTPSQCHPPSSVIPHQFPPPASIIPLPVSPPRQCHPHQCQCQPRQCHPSTSVTHLPVSPTQQCHLPGGVIHPPVSPTRQCHPPSSLIPPAVSCTQQCHPSSWHLQCEWVFNFPRLGFPRPWGPGSVPFCIIVCSPWYLLGSLLALLSLGLGPQIVLCLVHPSPGSSSNTHCVHSLVFCTPSTSPRLPLLSHVVFQKMLQRQPSLLIPQLLPQFLPSLLPSSTQKTLARHRAFSGHRSVSLKSFSSSCGELQIKRS